MGSRLEKKSNQVRKRIENHTFNDEQGEEYKSSSFGGFGDYFRRKKIKLQNLDSELRSQTANNPPIFKGVVIHVNGYTQPSLNDLHKLIVSHHGGFIQYLDGKTMVTHIIASNLTPKKAIEFKKYRIVKPAWVVDSVKAGRLLPWSSYKVIDEGSNQQILAFSDGKVINQKNDSKKGYRDQTDQSWYTKNIIASSSDDFSLSKTVENEKDEFLSAQLDQSYFGRVENELKNEAKLSDYTPKSSSMDENKNLVDISFDYSLEVEMNDDDQELQNHTEKLHTPTTVHMNEDTDTEEMHDDQPKEKPEEKSNDKSEDKSEATTVKILKKVSEHNDPNLEVITSRDNSVMTAEKHNSRLLSNNEVRKLTAVNPGFLDQYYKESRLHHLSVWKADLKAEMQTLADKKSPSQKLNQKCPPNSRRYILHIDFDCFFAAVSLLDHPELQDKPVVIAHGSGNSSEIASCNYVARKFGVKNGMWMKSALELCSDLKILPYNFPAYEQVSRKFYDQIINTGGIVQSVSIDEVLLDVTFLILSSVQSDGITQDNTIISREQSEVDSLAFSLRESIQRETDCNVSIGIGGNILLAKLALRKAKPAGQHQILSEEILDFISNFKVDDLPGVAYHTAKKLEQIGITFVKDIRETSKEKLVKCLGPKTGEKLWEYSKGIDKKEVGVVEVRKSVSADVTWGVRFENQIQVDEFIQNLCGELTKRLLKEKVKGKQLTLKIMKRSADAPLDPPKHLGHGHCDTFNKSTVLGIATNQTEILTRETLSLLKSFRFPPGELRGIGVQMTKLESINEQIDNSQKLLSFKPQNRVKDLIDNDPIEDFTEEVEVFTPKKSKSVKKVEFGAYELNQSTPSRKPLNTMGTQFILPTQFDTSVLAELPSDVRSKLVKSRTKISLPKQKSNEFQNVLTSLPSRSQIDPETLKALPPDMQAEILAFYEESPQVTIEDDIVSSSPSRSKPNIPRGRGRSLKVQSVPQTSYITAHFRRITPDPLLISDTNHSKAYKIEYKHENIEDIDPDYLAALPEDLREEAILAHRQQQLRSKNSVAKEKKRNTEEQAAKNRPAPITLLSDILPKKPPRAAFTKEELNTRTSIREAINEWIHEFKDEGPHVEDVHALNLYLEKVVEVECDMAKAYDILKWLDWCVNRLNSNQILPWKNAFEEMTENIQRKIDSKGLGRLKF